MNGSSGETTTRFPIRTKFIVAVTVLTLIIAVLILSFEQIQVRRTSLSQTVAQGESIADTIASTAGYYVIFGLTDDLNAIAADLRKNENVEYADFLSADGTILAATAAGKIPEALRSARPARDSPRQATVDAHGQPLVVFVRPFYESRDEADDAAATPRGYFRVAVNQRAAAKAVRSLAVINSVVLAIALLVGIGLAILAARLIVRPISSLVESADRIAAGDLTGKTAVTTNDELGSLASSFNRMTLNLQKTMGKMTSSQAKLSSVVETVGSRSRLVVESVDRQGGALDEAYFSIDKLNHGIQKITENVEALSASSEETSSSMLEMVSSMEEVARHTDSLFQSVEETSSATNEMVTSINEVDQNVDFLQNFVTDTSASMEQMSASIGQVESNAARSYDLALAVAEAAESGMKAVRETIEGMEHIRKAVLDSNAVVSRLGERSEAIGKILNVIDDIAEQTNLLALNAAILAAQAGEQGKGFSVVAAEIRELSERTASSTREIGSLIRSVQEEVGNALKTMSSGAQLVEGGVDLSHDAGRALNNILDSAMKSSNMVKEIASATRDQAQGSETVVKSIGRVQEMVKQINAATTQQAQGSDHILKAVETMREVTRYVRQATVEQKSGSVMISRAAERMIDMIHEIFEVAASQAKESEKIVHTMEQVRELAELNRRSAGEMNDTIGLLGDAMRGLDEEVKRFRVRV
ncbi:MAG TPA: methyl-accepting chemotaxis protein [Thermoanaerobaculia bacterium]|nr:methyl-accepting chemotaxis protein [Thermoanaerobaculia bacterium]